MKTEELFELADLIERLIEVKKDINQTFRQDIVSMDYLHGMFDAAALIRRYADDPNGSTLGMMKKEVK